MATIEELKMAIALVIAIGDTIRELDRGTGVPSGYVYAGLQGKIDLRTYEAIISALINAGQVKRDDSHLLHWTGMRPENN